MDMNLLDALEHAADTAAERVMPATVAIGRSMRGSGVVVAPGRVLTNAHNLRDRTTQVAFAGRTDQATVLAVDAASDLVVLEVDTGDITPIEWASDLPRLGSAVVAIARGIRGGRLSIGFVSGTDRTFRGPGGRPIGGSLEHTAPMAKGSSGGALVERTGAVVGINTHRLGEGFYLAQAAEPALVERIGALAEGRSPRRAELGIAVAPAEVARRLRRSVGLEERDGVLVRGVEEASPADRAGVREGDLVVRAADRDIAAIDDLHAVLGAHDPEDDLELGLVRGADELTVRVAFGPTEG